MRIKANKRSSLRASAAAILTALVVATLIPGQAMAAGAGAPSDGAGLVIFDQDGVKISVSDPKVRDKGSLARPNVGTSALACGNDCYFFPYRSRTITPPGGSAASIESKGQTNYIPYVVPVINNLTKVDFYRTVTSSKWFGSNPYYASLVEHQTLWDINYVGVTGYSWGGGGGSVNAGLGGGRIEITTSRANEWKMGHDIDHVYLSVAPLGDIFWTGIEVHGRFHFGGQLFTADANSGVVI